MSRLLKVADLHARRAERRAALDAVRSCLRALDSGATATVELMHTRANALIFRCEISGRALAVKYCRRADGAGPDKEAAFREFDALDRIRLAREAGNHSPATPIPVRLFAESGVYMMTWMAGDTLTRALLRTGLAHETRLALVGRAAAWLRQLHDLRRLPLGTLEIGARIAYLETLADGRSTSSSIVSETAAVLLRTASRASACALPVSWIHGDFKADNILVTETETVGLDCQLAFEKTIVHDLATFLNHLAVLRWYPAGLPFAAVLDELIESAPGQYDPASAEWGLALDWVRAYMLVQRVTAVGWRPRSWPTYGGVAQRMALASVLRRFAEW